MQFVTWLNYLCHHNPEKCFFFWPFRQQPQTLVTRPVFLASRNKNPMFCFCQEPMLAWLHVRTCLKIASSFIKVSRILSVGELFKLVIPTKGKCNYSVDIFQIQQLNYFFIRSKNDNKKRCEIGLLSLSNLEICIKKQNSLVLKLTTRFQR